MVAPPKLSFNKRLLTEYLRACNCSSTTPSRQTSAVDLTTNLTQLHLGIPIVVRTAPAI